MRSALPCMMSSGRVKASIWASISCMARSMAAAVPARMGVWVTNGSALVRATTSGSREMPIIGWVGSQGATLPSKGAARRSSGETSGGVMTGAPLRIRPARVGRRRST